MNRSWVDMFGERFAQAEQGRDFFGPDAIQIFTNALNSYPWESPAECVESMAEDTWEISCEITRCSTGMKRCESEIERALLMALCFPLIPREEFPSECMVVEDIDSFDCAMATRYGTIVLPQCRVGKYRVDFLIGANSCVFVECDGHEFHETKKAAARDKKRDRALQRIHPVLRFTGHEIWDDPFKCAYDIFDFIGRAGEK